MRYGYANLFDRILAPAAPPPLQTVLNATSVEVGQGYVTRLLRPGWVFIKEEVGGSYLHNFEYRRSESSHGGLVESSRSSSLRTDMMRQTGCDPIRQRTDAAIPLPLLVKASPRFPLSIPNIGPRPPLLLFLRSGRRGSDCCPIHLCRTNDYTLTFSLPNFAPGKSEIIASVTAFQQSTERTLRNPPIVHSEELTNILKDAIQTAVNRSSTGQAGGASTVLTLRVKFPMNCRLVWINEPVPNTYVPMRMLDGDSLTGEVSAEGVLSSPAAGMLGEDPR